VKIYSLTDKWSPKRESVFEDVTCHYHVFTNVTGAMEKRYACKGCAKGFDKEGDVTH
jgi:hypothetical protein